MENKVIRVLLFRRGDKGSKFDNRFETPAKDVEMTARKLNREEQSDIQSVLAGHDLSKYDRVVLDLKWGLVKKQAEALRMVPRLVIHESDGSQNFLKQSHEYKTMQRFYRELPRIRIIVTNAFAAQRFREMGFDAHYVANSYDDNFLYDMKLDRNIPHAFIGTIKDAVYELRNEYLKNFQACLGMNIFTTDCKVEYREKLNRIRFFISADVGMNEYMAKNFEAMGCGCLLTAYRQGMEEEYLGLRDLENVVLYSTVEEAIEKIRWLENDPKQYETVRRNGVSLAHRRFKTRRRDEKLFEVLRLPM